jgi:hypothetical protein
LFNQIAQTGAVVSEFPFGRRADRHPHAQPYCKRHVPGFDCGRVGPLLR